MADESQLSGNVLQRSANFQSRGGAIAKNFANFPVFAPPSCRPPADAMSKPNDPADLSSRNRQAIVQGWMYDTDFRPERPGWLKQLISRVRLWLRQHGIMVHHLSDDDIQSILARAARAEAKRRNGETEKQRNGERRYALENAVPSKDGYRVERVNENAGAEFNQAEGVVCQENAIFSDADLPATGKMGWIKQRALEYGAHNSRTHRDNLRRKVENDSETFCQEA